jgi:hypothetical protein
MAKIAHFEILELVVYGSMGAVHRAVDPISGPSRRHQGHSAGRGYKDGEESRTPAPRASGSTGVTSFVT